MISQHKVIGVCMAHSQNLTCDGFINELYKQARDQGYRVMLFAAITEPGNEIEEGLVTNVCEAVRLNVVDALIIIENDILTKKVYVPICEETGKVNMPVLLINGEHENCISLKEDAGPAFAELLKRLFDDRPFNNTLLMCGHPENDRRGSVCAEIYKSIGTYRKTVMYGESKDAVTIERLKSFIEVNGIPDVVICTDDHMASSVFAYMKAMDMLSKNEVIITGIGDVYTNDFFVYQHPTCRICPGAAAKICLDVLKNCFKGHPAEKEYILPMEPVLTFSGVNDPDDVLSMTLRHEKHMYSWIEKLLVSNDVSLFPYALSQIISSDSALCFNENAKTMLGIDPQDHKYAIIPSARTNYGKTEILVSDLQQVVPDVVRWMRDESLCILQPLTIGETYIGYYTIIAKEFNADKYKYRRVMNTLRFVLNLMSIKISRQSENGNEYAQPRNNAITGLPNAIGANDWFKHFSNVSENHDKCFGLAVYSLPKYNFIYENYGIYDLHDALRFIASALEKVNAENEHYIAHISPDRFMVLTVDEEDRIISVLKQAMNDFNRLIDEYNATSKKDFFIETISGFTVAAKGWKDDLDSYLQYAGNEMYKNQLRTALTETVKHAKIGKDQYSTFLYLLDNSLFTYHFQPIVDAKTGSIYGYEALMRTGGGIKMSPIDVLNMAKEFGRLYDIEKATFFGIMETYAHDFDLFRGRKLFINTIPGNFLTPEDRELLWEKYHTMMDHFVYEITEQDSISDEELEALKWLSKDKKTNQVAIDDFGTGHSNIANLIRYTPRIVKIDRFLISNIQNDTNKQMFVKNTIEFAKHNGIKVLAEGVETAEEMSTVIEYGVDLIQGYYTAKPSQEPLASLPPEIKKAIIAENLRLSRFDNDMMIYEAEADENVDIIALALRKYTYITVPDGAITFTGEKDNTVDLVIRVPDHTQCDITLNNVNIRGTVETTFQIGYDCKVRINLKGDNTLNKEGILVPPGSELILCGDGDLTINNNRNFSVGIGANFNDACGNITVNMLGHLSIYSSGDKVVVIGGGKGNGSTVNFANGKVNINARGINVVGIGCAKDDVNVTIGEKSVIDVFCSGDYSVGIGSLNGNASVKNSGTVNATADGETSTAIGTLNGAEGRIQFLSGQVKATVHCNIGCSVGSVSGRISIENTGGRTQVYGEGSRVRGFGSLKGSALCRVDGGIVTGSYLAAEGNVFGSENDRFIVNSGNIICDENTTVMYNDFGNRLTRHESDGDSFDQDILTPDGSYHYKAVRDPVTNRLSVYLPYTE